MAIGSARASARSSARSGRNRHRTNPSAFAAQRLIARDSARNACVCLCSVVRFPRVHWSQLQSAPMRLILSLAYFCSSLQLPVNWPLENEPFLISQPIIRNLHTADSSRRNCLIVPANSTCLDNPLQRLHLWSPGVECMELSLRVHSTPLERLLMKGSDVRWCPNL